MSYDLWDQTTKMLTSEIDEEIYEEYKLIIKELLFNGADRMLGTKDSLTPRMILQ